MSDADPKTQNPTNDDPAATAAAAAVRRTIATGFYLLAVFVPMGLTLEALHAMKVDVYLESATRREMWNLAHAHGGMLGILCLVFGPVAERWMPQDCQPATGRLLRWSAILMPLGFFVGGIGNAEGDPSLGIVLVPIGGVLLLVSLLRAAVATLRSAA